MKEKLEINLRQGMIWVSWFDSQLWVSFEERVKDEHKQWQAKERLIWWPSDALAWFCTGSVSHIYHWRFPSQRTFSAHGLEGATQVQLDSLPSIQPPWLMGQKSYNKLSQLDFCPRHWMEMLRNRVSQIWIVKVEGHGFRTEASEKERLSRCLRRNWSNRLMKNFRASSFLMTPVVVKSECNPELDFLDWSQ